MKVARRIALTAALSLPALSASAFSLELGRREPAQGRPGTGGYYDVNQDTAALFFSDAAKQRFEMSDTTYFAILRETSRERSVVEVPGVVIGLLERRSPSGGGGAGAPEPGVLSLAALGAALVVTRALRRAR